MKHEITKNKIILKDSISLDDIGVLKTIMDEELPKKSKKYTIDLKEVTSVDTSVIQFFIIFKKNLENQGIIMQFMNLSE